MSDVTEPCPMCELPAVRRGGRAAAPGAARGRHADHRGDHREVPAYAEAFAGELGHQDREGGPGRAGHLPRTWSPARPARIRTPRWPRPWRRRTRWAAARPAPAAASTRCSAAYRVGRPGRLAGAGRDQRRHRPARRDHRALRRAGLRLHRRALRGQRGRARRRARHLRPGPPPPPGAARPGPARRRVRARGRRRRRAGRLAAAADPDRRAVARAGRPLRDRPARPAHAAGWPRPARRPRRPVLLVPDAHGISPHPPDAPAGRPAARSSARPGPGCRRASSLDRAVRAARFAAPARRGVVDTEDHLVALVVTADAAGAGRPAGQGAGPARRRARRRRRPSWSRRCAAGCCTTAAARRWPPSCSCTRRPCATG